MTVTKAQIVERIYEKVGFSKKAGFFGLRPRPALSPSGRKIDNKLSMLPREGGREMPGDFVSSSVGSRCHPWDNSEGQGGPTDGRADPRMKYLPRQRPRLLGVVQDVA